MTQLKEKFVETHPIETNYNNLEPANQSIEPDITKKTSYDVFLEYYAKFMMIIGTLGQAFFYMQAYKIFTTKSADNLSLEGFLIPCFSLSAWLVYGLLIRDKVVILANVVGVIGAVLVVAAILKYS
ncbi:MAG: SemiSWEET family sugar transporter [Janthinobacterium lividum]